MYHVPAGGCVNEGLGDLIGDCLTERKVANVLRGNDEAKVGLRDFPLRFQSAR